MSIVGKANFDKAVLFDATCNPYFCHAAILMADLDSIKNKIDPHENGWGPYDMNLYHLPEEEKAKLQGLPTSPDAALDALEADHDYLTEGGVFPKELLKNFIKTKRAEVAEMAKIPPPQNLISIILCKVDIKNHERHAGSRGAHGFHCL